MNALIILSPVGSTPIEPVTHHSVWPLLVQGLTCLNGLLLCGDAPAQQLFSLKLVGSDDAGQRCYCVLIDWDHVWVHVQSLLIPHHRIADCKQVASLDAMSTEGVQHWYSCEDFQLHNLSKIQTS